MLLILTLALCIVLFSACSPSTDDASMEQKSRVSVDFSTFQVEVEDMSRSSRTALSTAATRLSFAVFNSNGTLVEGTTIHQEKTSGGTGFGTVELELFPDTYQMVAVAHNGDENADITSVSTLTLPGETFTDTFTKVQELKVEPNKDCSFTMSLNRITTAFILKLKDAVLPSNLKEIKVVLNTSGFLLSQVNPKTLDIDLVSGLALKSLKFTHTIPVATIPVEIPRSIEPLYFIAYNSPATVGVKATAYDTEGNEIISHTFDEVPLTPNKKTVASGTFFQSSASGFFTITSDWDSDDQEIEY